MDPETKFSDIPEELMSNIFSRLPAKCLKRLNCVNKSWYSLIQSSSLISQHYSYQSSNNAKLLLKRELPNISPKKNDFSFIFTEGDDDNHSKISCSPFKENSDITVVGPCINGIICLLDSRNFIMLWNPATGECKRLPRCRLSYPRKVYPYVEAIGFGWVSETNDYKVVMVVGFMPVGNYCNYGPPIGSTLTQVYVYSLSSNSWKHHSSGTPYDFRVDIKTGLHIFTNGACHWITSWATPDPSAIFSFHMRDEVFKSNIQLPDFEVHDRGGTLLSLSMLGDCIALIIHRAEITQMYFDMWVMVEYGVKESWMRKLKIGPLMYIANELGCGKGREFFMENKDGELLFMDIDSQEIKNLGIKVVNYKTQVIRYVESLVSLSKS